MRVSFFEATSLFISNVTKRATNKLKKKCQTLYAKRKGSDTFSAPKRRRPRLLLAKKGRALFQSEGLERSSVYGYLIEAWQFTRREGA